MIKCNDMLSLIYEFSKATRCCQREWNICEGLTIMQFYILDLIANKETLHLSNLHDLLSVEKSTTTRLIEPLLKRHLIYKEKSSEDCRAIILKLTKEGNNVHIIGWRCLETYFNSLNSAIPEGQRDVVYESVGIFLKAIKDINP